ncbi:hypothetical protein ACSNOK_20795 [Streptomyces sp. URMC 126]|uniref:hypothetical protein n=1 Tax=Streptomyces sp. URMC 126 TaxID=3423401 RepID=UPI003F1AC554
MSGTRGAAIAIGSLALLCTSVLCAPAGQADGGGRGSGKSGHASAHAARTDGRGAHGTGGIGNGILCTGPSESAYDPPLTLRPRNTRVHTVARYACTVAPGRTLPATGTLDGVSPEASCLSVATPRITETVRYADGTRSVIGYRNGTSVRVAGVLTVRLTGEVTSGRGAGSRAERDVQALPGQPPTQCLSEGLRGSTGGAQLEIRP